MSATYVHRPIVTLTTDFGLRDPYVAAMKGVIYNINPALNVVDLSHDIPPGDVFEASLFLAGALPYFPEGTVHVAVVDPGVGTNRMPIALRAGGQILVCPDNGLATLFLHEHAIEEVRVIENKRFMLPDVSATFHGRDIFAPAAACLAGGAMLSEMGQELDVAVTLDVPLPSKDGPIRIVGSIMHVDRFGNLITNIRRSMLGDAASVEVRAGELRLREIHRTYAETPPGMPLALFGSYGYLEIAINGGNAYEALQFEKGDEVVVTLNRG